MDVWGTVKEMGNGCDILVCTMGRIVHLLMLKKVKEFLTIKSKNNPAAFLGQSEIPGFGRSGQAGH